MGNIIDGRFGRDPHPQPADTGPKGDNLFIRQNVGSIRGTLAFAEGLLITADVVDDLTAAERQKQADEKRAGFANKGMRELMKMVPKERPQEDDHEGFIRLKAVADEIAERFNLFGKLEGGKDRRRGGTS